MTIILNRLAIAASAVALFAGAHAAQQTPLMGFSTYNYLACSPNDAEVTKAINGLADGGYVDAGYVYFTLDCGWASPDTLRDDEGRLQVDSTVFPNGLMPLAELARSRGLRWSMYSDAGARMCDTIVPSPRLGSLGYEAIDADFFKSFGAEYLKCKHGPITMTFTLLLYMFQVFYILTAP